MTIEDLPDEAHLRVVAADPPFDAAGAAEIRSAVDKLFVQFQREGRVAAWASECQAEGSLLVLAWTANPLSGCSHDKLHGLFAALTARSGRRIMDAPPIVVGTTTGIRCLDRAGLRGLIAAGDVDADSPIWLRSATTLGQWRREAGVRLADSALATLLKPSV